MDDPKTPSVAEFQDYDPVLFSYPDCSWEVARDTVSHQLNIISLAIGGLPTRSGKILWELVCSPEGRADEFWLLGTIRYNPDRVTCYSYLGCESETMFDNWCQGVKRRIEDKLPTYCINLQFLRESGQMLICFRLTMQ